MSTGTISTYESGVDLVVEWKFENFFNVSEEDYECYFSPEFSFGGERWYLRIFLNGSSRKDSSGHVDLCLWRCRSGRPIKQSFSLSLKTAKGEKYNEQNVTKDFEEGWDCHSFNRFIQRSDLTRRRYELVPDGVLTVVCAMKSSTSAGSATCVEACTQTQKHVFRQACTQTQKHVLRQACTQTQKHVLRQASTQTVEEKYFNCREKLLIVLCIVSILIAIVTGCALAYSKTPLSSSHPCGEAVTKIQISEINKAVNRSEVVESNEFDASGSNETGATDIKQSEGLNETSELYAKLNKADQSEIAGSEIPEASAANQADSAKTGESESVNKTLASEMNKTDQSEIAGSDIPEASAANEADTAETDESGSEETGVTNTKQSEGVNKTLAAELKKADQSEIARSDTPEASVANQVDSAKTDESEAATKIQTSEINKVDNRSDVVAPNEFEASGSNETGATDIKEYEGVNKTLAAEFNKADQSENAGSDIPESFAANQAHTAETDESEGVNKTLAAELKKADQSEIARSDTPEASVANQVDSAKTDESEAATKIQTSEINKVDNRSDVVAPNEFEASGSNETGATDIKEYEGVNKTLAAEFNKADQSENAGSDIPESFAANQAHTAETDESEPIPQPVLMVIEVGSTYLEVVWVLPEESKSNAAHIHYVVHFRKYGTQWQEVAFPDASRTSYTLTNLDPGMSYQIYVMAVDSFGFSRSSETATIRTSNNVISHNSPKGHEKQFVFYAAAIIILVIVIACVYDYSKTSLSATHPYGGGTQTISAEDNIIKADLSEIAEANESENSDSKTCSTETEGPVLFKNQPEDYGFVIDINHLLKENRGIDVTFELETPSGETKLFSHKLILAVMSSYFADEFYDKGRNKGHQVVSLKGINPKAFEQMIRYCYGEKPIFKTTEEACVLFKIASEFKVISLQNLCCNFFRHTKINPGNAFSILEISEEVEDKSLKDKCRKILEDKTREFMASYELCDVTPAMVHILLDLPSLSLDSEYELIKWIFDWAKVKSEDKDSSCRSTRDYLEKLLRNMNFLALTVEEFAILSRENPKVFNSDERASISLNIACPGSWEMPVWYNKDLKRRIYTGSIE